MNETCKDHHEYRNPVAIVNHTSNYNSIDVNVNCISSNEEQLLVGRQGCWIANCWWLHVIAIIEPQTKRKGSNSSIYPMSPRSTSWGGWAMQWVGWWFCTQSNSTFTPLSTLHIHSLSGCACAALHTTYTSVQWVDVRRSVTLNSPREGLTWARTQQEPNLHCSRHFPF